MSKILLVDGSSLAFRAFYGMNDLNRFKTRTGFYTNALYAFHTMLDAIITRENPTHILVAFDAGKTTFRTELFADYKGGRASMPEELAMQWPYFKIMLDALGIKHYDLVNYEADDIIGTLSYQANRKAIETIIVSGDKDMLQLVKDYVRVDITKKGAEVKSYTQAVLLEEFGLTPEQIIDMKALMGDSSDNYSGVNKVGEKTALKLIQEYQTLDNLYVHVDSMKASKLKENLINDKEMAYLSQTLATINQHAPIEITLDDIVYMGKQHDDLVEFYKKMEFNHFLKQLNVNHDDIPSQKIVQPIDYHFVTEITPTMIAGNGSFYLETLDTNYHTAQIIGVAWSNRGQYYVTTLDTALKSDFFMKWLTKPTYEKVVFDYKKVAILLSKFNIQIDGVIFDTLLAAYLLNAQENITEVAHLLSSDDNFVKTDEEIYGKGTKLAIPEAYIFYEHLASKVKCLDESYMLLKDKLVEQDTLTLYEAIEFPLSQVLAKMEMNGICVNQQTLIEMGEVISEKIKVLETEIYALAGEAFNVNSPKQLGEILFEKLQLPSGKKTKSGYSTAVDVLEKLVHYPIVEKLLFYRQLAKLNSTYIEGLQKYIMADQKIHTRFVQTLTQTGRLSSADPNLQNIPVRFEEARKIRQAFIPSEGYTKILSADYSQIELRVLAHIANDELMKEAFINNEDIHTSTAMRVFNVTKDEVDSNMRRQAKAVNFGIVYGISDYGLSQNLDITRQEAKQFIDTYFEKYPNIQQYMKDIVTFGKEHGYVETLYQRKRYLPDLKASNFNIRSFAERTAMNTPIQGTAADIIKIAMVKLDDEMHNRQVKSRLLLQVHDELIFEVVDDEIELMTQLVKETMENCIQLSVPLKVNIELGDSWYEAK